MELEYIYSRVNWISHPPDKRWIDHSLNVEKLAKKFFEDLPKSINQILPENVWNVLVSNISFFHDIGKGTGYFQEYIASENRIKTELSNHSLLSALIVYWIIEKLLQPVVKDNDLCKFYSFFAFFVVRYHHGDLKNPKVAITIENNQIPLIIKQWESIDKQVFDLLLNFKNVPLLHLDIDEKIRSLPHSFNIKRIIIKFLINNNSLDYYFIINTLFSLLIDADKFAAGLDVIPDSNFEIDEEIVDKFRYEKGWLKSDNLFDKLRNKAYNEVINSLANIDNRKIFSIQIPTGFGKTFTSLSFSIKLLKRRGLKRIIYCLPFTSIIDQNYQEIQNMFETVLGRKAETSLFLKHHHLSELFYNNEYNELSHLESELLIESWFSKIIVTTFVQLFHTLIGYKNKVLKKFHRLANSVIILDEIQSIPIKYWSIIKEMLLYITQNFNSYLVLVTATQPKIIPEEKILKLVNAKNYFESVNRTNLRINLDKTLDIDQLIDFIYNHSRYKRKVVIVLNTIRVSKDFFSKTKDLFKNSFYLSSYIIPKCRLKILNEINKLEEYYLVSTQLIEAGVNIDADVIFRDFSTLDSINQVAGRCNRFNQKNLGEVYVFKLKDSERKRLIASYIYDECLLDLTEKSLISKKEYEEREFLRLCNSYYEKLSGTQSLESNRILDSVKKLKYTDDDYAIYNFRLIDNNYEKFDVYIEYDEEATYLWESYCSILKIENFWDRHEEYLKIKNKFQNYVISVNSKDLKQNSPPLVNGIFYVPKNQLEEYYDSETGYKKISQASIW